METTETTSRNEVADDLSQQSCEWQRKFPVAGLDWWLAQQATPLDKAVKIFSDQESPICFDDKEKESLDWWRGYHADALEKAVKILLAKSYFLAFNKNKEYLEEFFYLGIENHVLQESRVTLGFNPSETQLNNALAWFLKGNGSQDVSRKRVRSFLEALFNVSIDNNDQLKLLFNEFDKKEGELWVESEVTVPGKKKNRIDLAIGWPDIDGQKQFQYLIIIENKFNHRVTDGQLAAYKKFSSKKSKNIFLFLVSKEGSPPAKKHSKAYPLWTGRSWLNLLRNWEKNLGDHTDIDDPDFRRLRRILWDKQS